MLMSAPMVVNGQWWHAVGLGEKKCQMVVLLSLSGGGTMVLLPWVCWDKGSRLVQKQEI